MIHNARRWFQGYTSFADAKKFVYQGDAFRNKLVATFADEADAEKAVAAVNGRSLEHFHKALRVLLALDRDELVNEGVLPPHDQAWEAFQQNPHRWFLEASADRTERLWALMQTRMQ